MTREELFEKAKLLPATPGVYIMHSKTGRIIYVGKSKALKNRVSSYFAPYSDHHGKTKKMVESVCDFEVYFTGTELEALLQENQFIKQFKPRYNIKLKNGGGYPYIKITNADYPVISVVYKRTKGNDFYFGPYSSHTVAQNIVTTLQKTFLLPDCSRVFPRDIGKSRPCINYQIGRCVGPCIKGNVRKEEYRDLYSRAVSLLKGDGAKLIEKLKKEMTAASDELNFELAAKLRDCIRAIKKINDRQQIVTSPDVEADIIGVFADDLGGALSLLFVRNGAVVDRENFFFGADEIVNSQALESFIQRYYDMRGYIPKKIYIDFDMEKSDLDILSECLTEKAGVKAAVIRPQRGNMRALAEKASENAKNLTIHKRATEDRSKNFLVSFAKLLCLEVLPDRIESYDISHSGGDFTSCGMIVVDHGRFAKKKYRAFTVKEADRGSDTGALTECLTRRFTHSNDESGWEYPDLILMDGGVGQVHAALAVLENLDIQIPVFGMIKDEHHKTRTLTDGEHEISLITHQDAFVFVYKIQEEVHRYSLSLMDAKRRSAVRKSSLTEIKGIGDKRANDLMLHFGTLDAIKNASEAELTKVKGITPKIARAVINAIGRKNDEDNNGNSTGNETENA